MSETEKKKVERRDIDFEPLKSNIWLKWIPKGKKKQNGEEIFKGNMEIY